MPGIFRGMEKSILVFHIAKHPMLNWKKSFLPHIFDEAKTFFLSRKTEDYFFVSYASNLLKFFESYY